MSASKGISHKPTLLFRSTGNVDLSIIAQALLTEVTGQPFAVYSAGNNPQGKDHLSQASSSAMEELSIDIRQYDVNICSGCFMNEPIFDYAIALSPDMFNGCVHVAGDTRRAFWQLPESQALAGTEYDALDTVRSARDRLKTRVAKLAELAQEPGWLDKPKEAQEEALRFIHQEALQTEELAYSSTRAGKGVVDLTEREGHRTTKRSDLLTVVFDEEAEYVKFVRHVYKNWSGQGLEFTNVPIVLSARVTPELLARTEVLFHMHPVTDEDTAKVKERLKGHRPFDPETIKGRHVPGFEGPGESSE